MSQKNEKTPIRLELERLLPRMALLSIPTFLVSLFFGFSLPFLAGLVVGTAYAMVSLVMLGITIERSVEKGAKKGTANMYLSYGVRYLVLFLICFVAIETGWMSFIAIIIPQFFARIILWLETLFPKLLKK